MRRVLNLAWAKRQLRRHQSSMEQWQLQSLSAPLPGCSHQRNVPKWSCSPSNQCLMLLWVNWHNRRSIHCHSSLVQWVNIKKEVVKLVVPHYSLITSWEDPIHMLRYQKPTMKVPTAQAEIAWEVWTAPSVSGPLSTRWNRQWELRESATSSNDHPLSFLSDKK